MGPPFMWEEGARIYGTSGVHNNFPINCELPIVMSYLNLSFSFFTFFSLTFFLSWNFYDPKMKKSRVRSFLVFNHKLVLYFLFLRKFFISLLFKHNTVVNNSNTNINYLKQIIVTLVMIWFLFILSFFIRILGLYVIDK